MWAAYDLDKGWYRTFQLIAKNKYTAGTTGSFPVSVDEGGAFGHPYWGYWDGRYHAINGATPVQGMSSRTFEGFSKLVFPDDLKILKVAPKIDWYEGTAYTFSDDRAWIMTIDFDATQPPRDEDKKWVQHQGQRRCQVLAMDESGRMGKARHCRHGSNHAGRVAAVLKAGIIVFLCVEGKASDNCAVHSFSSTLKYFKSTDGASSGAPSGYRRAGPCDTEQCFLRPLRRQLLCFRFRG